MKLNDAFRATETGEEFKLANIIDKAKGTVKGVIKLKTLDNPIYEFEYTNRPGKGNFTCYLEHIQKSLSFNSWEKI